MRLHTLHKPATKLSPVMSSLAKLLRTGPLNIPAVFDDAFDALISRLMREWEIPGVSIAIVPLSGAAPVFKTYGLAHGDEAITPKVRGL